MSYIRWPVRASPRSDFGTPRLCSNGLRTDTCEYQRRHHPDEPQRRCSIHDRPTCPFSADDGAYVGYWKGPRPVSCKVNLRFRRFGSGTVQPNRLSGCTFDLLSKNHRAPRPSRDPTIWLKRAIYPDLRPSARVPSPWTLTRSFVS
jgi:hypothetical protein